MLTKIKGFPTPTSGLALGIASIGWSFENTLPLNGIGQNIGAIIALILLIAVSLKFILHPSVLFEELKHPVIGSVIPTFAMAWMVVSKAVTKVSLLAGEVIWLAAIVLHLLFVLFFFYHRMRDFQLSHLIPSWFVPPIGIIVADVTLPSPFYFDLALVLLFIGMISYLILLPLMIYRFIFHSEVIDAAKPTIAILAAPASLCLAGYLTIIEQPSLLLCAILLGIGLLMTLIVYLAFYRLMQLPFSPGYAAFTFPMAIGATALYKLSYLINNYPQAAHYAKQLHLIADVEAWIALVVIGYVAIRYLLFAKNKLFAVA